MPKETTVELGDGTKVVLRSLKHKEVKKLRKQSGIAFSPKDKTVFGDFEGYEENYIVAAIVTPEKLKSLDALGEIENEDYDKLRDAAFGVKAVSKDEKDFLSG